MRVLEPLGLTSSEVARAIHVLPVSILQILQEEMRLSAKMAVRLGRYFGNGPEFWAGLQMRHDLAVAARELSRDLRKIAPPMAAKTAPRGRGKCPFPDLPVFLVPQHG